MKLWIDAKPPEDKSYVHTPTYDEAVEHLKTTQVTDISIVNHLIGDRTGYDVAMFIEAVGQPICWRIHSPEGAKHIRSALLAAEKRWRGDHL